MTTEEKMRRLGQMIERARRDKRLQTRQVAEYAGISSSELNRVESGESWPSDHAWERISDFFGFPVDMMAAMKKERHIAPPLPTQESTTKQEAKVDAKVIDFAAHLKKKWQQTSLFEKD
ncbi:MAG TPA: hypothetical protein DIC56_19895 [Rhizobium sp.]|nr:hypothetical protein [Rhizobium sp.]